MMSELSVVMRRSSPVQLIFVRMVYELHHEQVRKGAEQERAAPKNGRGGDFEKKNQRQAGDGQQATCHHDEQVIIIHIQRLTPLIWWILDD